jgi:D-alanyl-D-alanine carboxypeptidase
MRRRWLGILAGLIAVAAIAALTIAELGLPGNVETLAAGGADPSRAEIRHDVAAAAAALRRRVRVRRERMRARYALQPLQSTPPVDVEIKHPPRAGVLFNVDTGEVLWQLHPDRELPIASLTKMMTALVLVDRHRPGERVLITPEALAYQGSGVGVLPEGKRVRFEALMDGLLLVSGNDAAIALAQHDAGSVSDFVDRMNRRARRMGLDCSHFTSPHGLQDTGNYSCPRDLAALARADLDEPRVSRIVGSNEERFPFPIKGNYLDLYNNNPFIRAGRPGVTGVKTGYTDAAGRCYVITERRGDLELGVVLLHSPYPLSQVPRMLDAGFRAAG